MGGQAADIFLKLIVYVYVPYVYTVYSYRPVPLGQLNVGTVIRAGQSFLYSTVKGFHVYLFIYYCYYYYSTTVVRLDQWSGQTNVCR